MRFFHLAALFLLLLSGERSQADGYQNVTIDFSVCRAENRRVDVGFGSTTYEVIGKSRHGCVMLFGGEIENPNWDGFLDSMCVIPAESGAMEFPVGDYGVDFSRIADHCGKTPRKKAAKKAKRAK